MSVRSWTDRFAHCLLRRKSIRFDKTPESLDRCLNSIDLTALGIGCTIGSGIYVVAGQVALRAGPSVILSFLVAGVAAILAGLCYAEFGALVPRAGSAYIYSYVTVGELWAFVIGWNLVLEYVIGTAAVARATSAYIDSLTGKIMSRWLISHLPITSDKFADYPDLLALSITITLTIILCFGVKESSFLNNLFTVVNLVIILYVIICGCFKADFKNWQIPVDEIDNGDILPSDKEYDHGGFFPYGIGGMLSGAANCFYAFVGFDVIATTGEEVINPSKAIPLAICLSLTICGIGYIASATILTLIVPYFLLDDSAPLSIAFDMVGWRIAYYIISVGAICSLTSCLLTTMFPMPRILFAMARDGLLFKFLARVNERFKIPVIATLVSGMLAGVFACVFDVGQLVEMMSIGTMLAFTLVSSCVLILRYEMYYEDLENSVNQSSPLRYPTNFTSKAVKFAVFLLCILTVWLSLVIDFAPLTKWWGLVLMSVPTFFIFVVIVFIARQPMNSRQLEFQVPFVPLLPTISILINVYLMLKLPYATWIRFGVWLAIGGIIYFGYGIRHGSERLMASIRDEIIEDNEPPPLNTPPVFDHHILTFSGQHVSNQLTHDLVGSQNERTPLLS